MTDAAGPSSASLWTLGTALREMERLRAGIQAMLDGNYPHPRKYRPGKCPHGTPYYDECPQCDDEWLRKLLNPEETT